jgi:hypothetical protein
MCLGALIYRYNPEEKKHYDYFCIERQLLLQAGALNGPVVSPLLCIFVTRSIVEIQY